MMQSKKSNARRAALVLCTVLAMTSQALAAPACGADAAAALKTAAVQQQLMVAGLSCGKGAAYNRFVLDNQQALQKSDQALLRYFKERDGSEAGYDSYKTKLANLAAGRSAADGARYCAGTDRIFAAARGRSLEDVIAGERLLISAPEACAIKYDRVDVARPSYDLPATLYGAAQDRSTPASTAYDEQPPRDYAQLPRPPRYASRTMRDDWEGAQSYYGPPPGWQPRPRRSSWYARSAYNDD